MNKESCVLFMHLEPQYPDLPPSIKLPQRCEWIYMKNIL